MKKQARIDQYRERAEKARVESDLKYKEAKRMGEVIPMGQPILIGHHSEKADRNYRARIDKKIDGSYRELKKAEHYERKAEAAEKNRAISSDDPEAVQKLKAKIEKAEKYQARMKQVNQAFKKGDEALKALGLTDEAIYIMKAKIEGAYSWEKQPFPSYCLTNNNANIRRMKKRLEDIESQQGAESSAKQYDGFEIVEDIEDNRIRILFDGKPPENIRSILKQCGFRWSPYNKAWQRHLNNAGRGAVEQAINLMNA